VDTWPAFYSAITGRSFTLDDALLAGERIANMRLAFNLREGINPLALRLPNVVIGVPPLEAGTLRGITVDVDQQIRDYLRAADWDPVTCDPSRARLEALSLDFLLREEAAVAG
jgi:aldehyde:ferredoxin oxidoreductase